MDGIKVKKRVRRKITSSEEKFVSERVPAPVSKKRLRRKNISSVKRFRKTHLSDQRHFAKQEAEETERVQVADTLARNNLTEDKRGDFIMKFISKIFSSRRVNYLLLVLISMSLFLVSLMNSFHSARIEYTTDLQGFSYNESHLIPSRPKKGELLFHVSSLKELAKKEVQLSSYKEIHRPSRGKIRIFNNYSTQPQKLVKGTRFESTAGDIFLLEESLTLPGRSADTPGSIDAELVSEKTSIDQNIDLTDFSIPTYRELGLDKKYENIYALSLTSFKGAGSEREYYLSDKERSSLVAELKSQNTSLALAQIVKELDGRFIIPDDSAIISYGELSLDHRDQQVIASQEAYLTVPLLEKESLEEFLISKLNLDPLAFTLDNISELNVSVPNRPTNYSELSFLRINFDFSGELRARVDEELLRENTSEKSSLSLDPILKSISGIDTAEIRIKPFWKKTLPSATHIKTQNLSI